MAYDPKAFSKMVGGGGCPDIAPKRDTARPRNFIGRYVTDIGSLRDFGKEHNPAPQQGFRKESPSAKGLKSVDGALPNGEIPGGDEPDWQEIQNKSWR